MKDILFQLKNHTSTTPGTSMALIGRACEALEHHRSLIIEMLAALSWLQENGHVPSDVDLRRIENNARDILDIETDPSELPPLLPPSEDERFDIIGRYDTPRPTPPAASLPEYKICPRCGDRNPKIVHLRRRPKAGLQCSSCGYEYPVPARWI